MALARPGILNEERAIIARTPDDLPEVAWNVAVALTYEDGQPVLKLASATSWGNQFYGFLPANSGAGIMTGCIRQQGGVVTPWVEGGLPLVVNNAVFLSATPGRVSCTAPPVGSIVRVGKALTTTTMMFDTLFVLE